MKWVILILIIIVGLGIGAFMFFNQNPEYLPSGVREVFEDVKVWENVDFQLSNIRWERGWNISVGYYHNVYFTVENRGNASGYAVIRVLASPSGKSQTRTVYLGAGASTPYEVYIDSDSGDSISVMIQSQGKN